MERQSCSPRPDWEARILEQGINFSDDEGRHYWNETAFYRFSSDEIDALEAATQELHTMCLQVVENVVSNNRWDEWEIPEAFRDWVAKSWREREPSLYGRFDLWFDGRDIKLLEYNADTPTGLIEAAVAQWYWLSDNYGESVGQTVDQFNSIHERLIATWTKIRVENGANRLHVASIPDGEEDFMTASYLRDVAQQGGLSTSYLAMDRLGWHDTTRQFRDESERPIEWIFKLYPWEWMFRESFGAFLPQASTRWLEPAWKAILSNKMLLVGLWELFPDHPLLLRADTQSWSDSWARKPIFGREGANVVLRRNGQDIASSPGLYTGRAIYQELRELPQFDGNFVVVGSWIVGDVSCGIGLREADALVTTNTSRFVPHLFRS